MMKEILIVVGITVLLLTVICKLNLGRLGRADMTKEEVKAAWEAKHAE